MCGRFRLARNAYELMEYFGVDEADLNWEPHYNIAPTQQVVTVRQNATEPRRELGLMRWGLVPFWAKDISIGSSMINAMSETAASKPAFRDAMKTRRCLVPADGFYEWQKISAKEKQPYNFGLHDGSIFCFAGLWERWRDPSGALIHSCTILTTTPNSLTADVHNRMPVMLRREDYDTWLDPGITNPALVNDLLKPFDAREMLKYPVSTRVGSVKNDDPACAEPITIEKNGLLFG